MVHHSNRKQTAFSCCIGTHLVFTDEGWEAQKRRRVRTVEVQGHSSTAWDSVRAALRCFGGICRMGGTIMPISSDRLFEKLWTPSLSADPQVSYS